MAGVVLVSFLLSAASATVWQGDTLPSQLSIDGKKLTLNGMGSRRATLLNVRVYVAGLYLEKPSPNPQAILRSSQLKVMEMRFSRDVSRKQINDAWAEGFKKNCGDNCDALRGSLEKLEAQMQDMKEGDTMELVFNEELSLRVKNQPRVTIRGPMFSDTILKIWLGWHPVDKGLKEKLVARAKELKEKGLA